MYCENTRADSVDSCFEDILKDSFSDKWAMMLNRMKFFVYILYLYLQTIVTCY